MKLQNELFPDPMVPTTKNILSFLFVLRDVGMELLAILAILKTTGCLALRTGKEGRVFV